MRNYWTSDYAVNKGRGGLVYQFADGSEIEVSLADYLRDNPDKTQQDFQKLKALSDELYHKQDLDEAAYAKRKRKLDWIAESEEYAVPPVDTALIQNSPWGASPESGKAAFGERRADGDTASAVCSALF